LNEISHKTGGDAYTLETLNGFSHFDTSAKIKTKEDLVSIIKYKLAFFVILLLVTFEWIIRKIKNII